MDILFGTYRCPDHEPPALGIEDPIPRSYLGQMLWPFRRRKATPTDMQPNTKVQSRDAIDLTDIPVDRSALPPIVPHPQKAHGSAKSTT
jgi:hypothetical protein